MVNSVLPVFLAMLAISRAVGAVPTAAAAVPFTFGQWVEDIIANPDGDHLTADEAVQAFYASANSTQSSEHAKRGPLQERAARCYEQPNTEAYIPDAVACIQWLASKGGGACPDYRLCQLGRAVITADGVHTSSCNDCARGAGYVMDQCTRAGSQWVQGSEFAHGNGQQLIRIRAP